MEIISKFKSKTFIISIFFFFFLFFFLNSVSAICFFGLGNTCAFVPSTFDELSNGLLVSYRFEQPFDLGADFRVWNSAGLQHGIIFPDDEVNDFLVKGFNLAFDFNKSTGTNMTTQIQGFRVNQPFAFSAFIKGNQGSIYVGPILAFSDNLSYGGQTIFQFGIYPYFDRRLQIYWTTNTDIINIKTKDPVPDNNEFQQIGFSYDGSGRASGFKIYVNGDSVPFDVVSGDILTNSSYGDSDMRIGSLDWSNIYLNATLDNVLIYDRVKSARVFKTLYNDGLGYTNEPYRIGYFRPEYLIGGHNITTKGYNLNLDNYYTNFFFTNLHYFDPAFGRFMSLQALKPSETLSCASGDIYVCLNSTRINNDYYTKLLFTSPIGDQVNNEYFESFYLVLANPFGHRLASFNVGNKPVALPPYNTGFFKSSYNLDLYPPYNSNSTEPNLVLKMNDYFSNAKAGNLRFYTYINVSYGNLSVSIPHNNSYYGACDTSQKIALCYYNYEALNLNDIWLVFYSQEFKQSYKVTVIAGNSFGFANQSFGVTSAGAVYDDSLSSSTSGMTEISLRGLALLFIGLFPEASTLSAPVKYAYVILSIMLLMGIGLIFFKSALGIILSVGLSILAFIFYIFIDYVSIIIVILLVLVGVLTLTYKYMGGGQ